MEQNEQSETSTFKDRMAQKQKESQEKVVKARNPEKPSIQLSEIDRKFGMAMMPLLGSPAFKAFQEFEQFCMAENLSKAYEKPNPQWFDSQNYGELMAFKKGIHIGLQLIRLNRDNLIRALLDEQEKESAKKEASNG